ncbi:MAG: putative Ig domain-containing protein, partial [Fibrobacteria bacterium]|nr:putative Ig domain-containing protein [Fibrobacteria bacterium]
MNRIWRNFVAKGISRWARRPCRFFPPKIVVIAILFSAFSVPAQDWSVQSRRGPGTSRSTSVGIRLLGTPGAMEHVLLRYYGDSSTWKPGSSAIVTNTSCGNVGVSVNPLVLGGAVVDFDFTPSLLANLGECEIVAEITSPIERSFDADPSIPSGESWAPTRGLPVWVSGRLVSGELPSSPLPGIHRPSDLDLRDFVLWGSTGVRICDRIHIDGGWIGSNAEVNQGVEARSEGISARGTVYLRERAKVLSDVVSPAVVQQNAVDIFGVHEISTPTPRSVPSRYVTPGTEDVSVWGGQSIHLVPGVYRDLHAWSGAKVHLSAGQYTFRSFKMETDDSLVVEASAGAVQLEIQADFQIGDRSKVVVENAEARSFQVHSEQSSVLRIGCDVVFVGWLEAPHSTIDVFSRTIIRGALHGNEIILEPDVGSITGGVRNRPPQIVSLSDSSATVGSPWSYWPSANDPDGDLLAWGMDPNSAGPVCDPSSGRLAWTPEDTARVIFNLVVEDGHGGADRQTVVIHPINPNRAPVITSIAPISVVEGASYSYTVVATDADGDVLSYVSGELPEGMTFDVSTRAFAWTPGYDAAGSYPLSVTVTDGKGGEATQAWTLDVVDANRAPVITSTAPTSIVEGASYSYTVVATDADGDVLSYVSGELPEGMTFDVSTRTFAWTPGYDAAGSYPLSVTVTDGKGGEATQAWTLDVVDANRAPVITSTAPTSVVEGASYSYTVVATDADGDVLSYVSGELPEGMTFDVSTRTFAWTPGYDAAGSYPLSVTVTDGKGGEATQAWTLDVVDANRAPVITSTAPTSVVEGASYSYTVVATDADGDVLTNTAGALPEGMTFDVSTRTFAWTPGYEAAGSYPLSVTVTDGKGGEASQAWTLDVVDANRAPVITSIAPTSVVEGASYSYTVVATDVDGDVLSYVSGVLPEGMTFDVSTRTFAWTPGYDASGSYPLSVTVTDGKGGEASQAWTLDVVDANRAPVITSTAPTSVVEGASYSYTVVATDADGDVLTNTAGALPEGMTFDVSTRTFAWTPGYEAAGSYPLSVTVRDGKGGEATQAWTLEVVDANRAPVITSIAPTSVVEGASYSYTVVATDADGDVLSYVSGVLPEGMTFDALTQTFAWTPGYEAAGSYPLSVTVRDGKGGEASQAWTLDVVDANRAPVITSIAPTSVVEGTSYSYTVTATDADGDVLSYVSGELPEGMTFDALTQTFAWTPGYEAAGSYPLSVTVTDGKGGEATQAWTLDVVDANRAPVITSIAPTSVVEGASYSYTVTATDADGDVLSYVSGVLPEGMTFDALTQTLAWTPGYDAAGSYPLSVTVTDGKGGEATQAWTLDVVDANRAPMITSTAPTSVVEGASYSYTVVATDADGDVLTYAAGALPEGMTFDVSTRTFAWTPGYEAAGSYPLSVTVRDGKGGDASQAWTLDVVDANRAPVITSIAPTSVVEGASYSYTVTATDADGDVLTYMAGALPEGMTFDVSTRTFAWTPGYEAAGSYPLSVTVTDGKGGEATQTWTLEVVDANRAPKIVSIPGTRVTVDSLYVYDVDAVDPDLDALRYELRRGPMGMTIEATTGLVRWLAPPESMGVVDTVAVAAVDNRGMEDEQTYLLYVSTSGPKIVSTPVTSYSIPYPSKAWTLPWTIRDFDRTKSADFNRNYDEVAPGLVGTRLGPDRKPQWVGPAGRGGIENEASFGQWFRDVVDTNIRIDANVSVYGSYLDRSQYLTEYVPGKSSNQSWAAECHTGFLYRAGSDQRIGFLNSENASWLFLNDSLVVDLGGIHGSMDSWIYLDTLARRTGLENGSWVSVDAFVAAQRRDRGGYVQLYFKGINLEPGQQYNYDVDAVGGIGRKLYSLAAGPVGMKMNSDNGMVYWNPDLSGVGNHLVRVRVTDSIGQVDSQGYVLRANSQLNRPPRIVSEPVLTAIVDSAYTYDVDAVDPDIDALTYELRRGPMGMTIDAMTGLVRWVAPPESMGVVDTVVVAALDDRGMEDEQTYLLYVSTSGPKIVSTPVTSYSIPYPSKAWTLPWTIRDFDHTKSSDFNVVFQDHIERDLVASRLGPDGKPQWIGPSGRGGIESKASFGQWYRDVPDTNVRSDLFNGAFDASFTGFLTDMVPGGSANRSWTGESHAGFVYHAGTNQRVGLYSNELTSWLFLNDTLVIDQGGIHNGTEAWVSVDTVALRLGVSDGSWMRLDIFVAARSPSLGGALRVYHQNASLEPGQQYTYDVDAVGGIGRKSYTLAAGPVGMKMNPDNGMVYWNPDLSGVGNHLVRVRVTDSIGQVDSQSYVLRANSQLNRPPRIVSEPVLTAIVDSAYTYDVDAVDPDIDALSYELRRGPMGMTIDAMTGLVRWVAPPESMGVVDTVVVAALDDRGMEDEQTYLLYVSTSGPKIVSTPVTSYSIPYPSKAWTLPWTIRDFDHTKSSDFNVVFQDHIERDLVASRLGPDGKPQWIGPSGRGGIESKASFGQWYRDVPDTNVRSDLFNGAFDASFTGFLTDMVPGGSANRSWTGESHAGFVYHAGTNQRVGLYSNELTSWLFLNDTLVIDQGGIHNGTEAWVSVDTVALRLGVSDGSWMRLDIFVAARSPSLGGALRVYHQNASLEPGQQYTYDVDAVGGIGRKSYTLAAGPVGMKMNPDNGMVYWNPDLSGVGNHLVRVRVTDSIGQVDSQSYVLRANSQLNRPPRIVSEPVLAANFKEPYIYSVVAQDPDGDTLEFRLLDAPDGMEIDTVSGIVIWSASGILDGYFDVSVEVTDPSGESDRQDWQVHLGDPSLGGAEGIVYSDSLSFGSWKEVDPSERATTPVRLDRISTPFNAAIGIDYQESTNNLIMSVNYGTGGSPYNLEKVLPDGTHVQFSGLSGLTDELKIAVVRRGNRGGFQTGDLFTGNGIDGEIVHVSEDGSVVENPWVSLPGTGNGLMRGSLAVDPFGSWGGDLVVVTTSGEVWRITSSKEATKLASVNTHLEGMAFIPSRPDRYGPLAGLVCAGAENQGLMYCFDQDGTVKTWNLGVDIEDMEIIRPGEHWYGVNYGSGRLLGVDADQWRTMAGDILLHSEYVAGARSGMWHLWFENDSLRVNEIPLAQGSVLPQQWEHATFARAGVVELPPMPPSNPIANWTVWSDLDSDSQIDSLEPLTTTDSQGNWRLEGLAPGPARIRVLPVEGWVAINPDSAARTVRIDSGAIVGSVEFSFAPIDSVWRDRPPVIIGIPTVRKVVVPDGRWTYTPSAHDSDGDVLTWRLHEAPVGMMIDASTGALDWSPTIQQAGPHRVTIIVDDGRGGMDFASWIVHVGSANESPKIHHGDVHRVFLGREFFLDVDANDSEDGQLPVVLAYGPEGMILQDGRLTWTPDALGKAFVVLQATDRLGASDYLNLVLNPLDPAKCALPFIRGTPPESLWLGESMSWTPQIGSNNWEVAFVVAELVDSPIGATWNGSSVQWIPDSTQLGTHRFGLRVFDEYGMDSVRVWDVEVVQPNRFPVLSAFPEFPAHVGSPWTARVLAMDPDGDPLRWSLLEAPLGMTIDQEGQLNWPLPTDAGFATIRGQVKDDRGGQILFQFDLPVLADQNLAPTLAVRGPAAGLAGQTMQYDVMAKDPEGGAVQLRIGPSSAAGGILQEGRFQWTGTAPGQFFLELVAEDSLGASVSHRWEVGLEQDSEAPRLELSASPVDPKVGDTVSILAVAQDPSGIVSTRLSVAGQVLSVQAGHAIWIPQIAGTASLTWEATDSLGNATVRTLPIEVQAGMSPLDPGDLPSLTIMHSPSSPQVGEVVSTSLEVARPENLEALFVRLDGRELPVDVDGTVRWEVHHAGSYIFEAVLRAVDGTVETYEDTVEVPPAIASGDLSVSILSVAGHSVATGESEIELAGVADVRGSVSAEVGCDWTLEWIGPEGGIMLVGLGQGARDSSFLGLLDATVLENGPGTLRLTVRDAAGRETSDEVALRIVGEKKLGIFSIAFTDLRLPLSGMELAARRTYDSRRRSTKGDFGWGWDLDMSRVEVLENMPQGDGWTLQWAGPFGRTLRSSRKHTVTVRIPGLRTQEFVAKPEVTLACGGASICFSVPNSGTMTYEAQPGTYGKLQPADMSSSFQIMGGTLVSEDNLVDEDGALQPYDPDEYLLTLADGSEWWLDQKAGRVSQIKDANGNLVQFSGNQIVHSDGRGILMTRDAQNRISEMRDGTGRMVRYAYDADGNLASATDPAGNITRFRYNASHYLTDIVDPRGVNALRVEYDSAGRVVRQITAKGDTLTSEHDLQANVETMVSPKGTRTSFTYDDQGNVTSKTVDGHTWTYTLDANGKVTRTDNPDGTFTASVFDAMGNEIESVDALGHRSTRAFLAGTDKLLLETDPLGRTSRYEYDARGNLLRSIGPDGVVLVRQGVDGKGNVVADTSVLGVVTTYTYDASSHRTSQTDGLGRTNRWTYDSRGNVLTEVDATGQVTTHTYDANGNRTSSTLPDGRTTRTEYTSFGKPRQVVDALGRTTRTVYDATGQAISTIRADGSSTGRRYDAEGNVIGTTDAAGRSTTMSYDPEGRLIETVFVDSASVRSEYDAMGRRIASIDAAGHRTVYEYDAAGRDTLVRDAQGHETVSRYDAAGRKIEVVDALGRRTQTLYDLYDRVVKVVYPDGSFDSTEYDAAGRKTAAIDAMLRRTEFSYDAAGQLVAVQDPSGETTRYEYDPRGNRTSQIDAKGRATTFRHDALGRQTAKVYPDGALDSTEYDEVGQVLRHISANGEATRFAYDLLGREIRRTLPSGKVVTTEWNVDGSRASVLDDRGLTRYGYDARGRLASVSNPDGSILTYGYDRAGRIVSRGTPWGETRYVVDALGRLDTLVDSRAGSVAFGYDALGRTVSVARPNGIRTLYEYTQRGMIGGLRHVRGSNEVVRFSYDFDASGLRIGAGETFEGTVRPVGWTHDRNQRLTDESRSGVTSSWEYDAVSNRISQTVAGGSLAAVFDTRDRLTSLGAATYAWDVTGRLRSRVRAGETTTFAWGDADRLVRADLPSGTTIAYTYDAQGKMVSRTDASGTTGFVWDGTLPYGQVVATTSAQGDLDTRWVYGADRMAEIHGDTVLWLLGDGLGTIRALADSTGSLVGRTDFDAWGNRLLDSGRTSAFGYRGEWSDSATGLVYLRARWMDPSTGRFASEDPYEGDPNGPVSLHRYVYAASTPIRFIDPTGRSYAMTTGDLAAAESGGGILDALSVMWGRMAIS